LFKSWEQVGENYTKFYDSNSISIFDSQCCCCTPNVPIALAIVDKEEESQEVRSKFDY
jgi:hypothetical protein